MVSWPIPNEASVDMSIRLTPTPAVAPRVARAPLSYRPEHTTGQPAGRAPEHYAQDPETTRSGNAKRIPLT